MEINSGIAESRPKLNGQLSLVEEKIFNLISHRWPTSAIEIAHHFEEDVATREARKKASTKYSYHLRKLVEKQLVLSKKVGNAAIYWPLLVEKYRVIHDILEKKE